MKAVIVDNGAYTVKHGWANSSAGPRVSLNCLSRGKNDRRTFIGDELQNCRDYAGVMFQLAFQKGYLVNWDCETIIWDFIFGPRGLKCNPSEHILVMTEPVCNLPNIQETYDQFIFEDYGFHSFCRVTAPFLAGQEQMLSAPRPTSLHCQLIIDSGFSFTTIVGLLDGYKLPASIRRFQIGGKLMTNYLKEMISYRQWNMMDETYIVNQVKETCCFVSQDIQSDLNIARRKKSSNSIIQEYVLPDQTTSKHGYLKERGSASTNEQLLIMNNERFMIPELLFHPSDVGISQAGMAEAVVDAIQSIPSELQASFYNNIILIGGNANLPGIAQRLQKDVRQLAPAHMNVQVTIPPSPTTAAWRGGALFAQEPLLHRAVVTKHEYDEHGSSICKRRFIL